MEKVTIKGVVLNAQKIQSVEYKKSSTEPVKHWLMVTFDSYHTNEKGQRQADTRFIEFENEQKVQEAINLM